MSISSSLRESAKIERSYADTVRKIVGHFRDASLSEYLSGIVSDHEKSASVLEQQSEAFSDKAKH